MQPLVSVVIPTYNRWPILRDAVQSVLGQSYKGFELIVVDDGSQDGTADHLRRYGPRLRLFSQRRRGVAAARNLGARCARGRYLAFLDSDDLWQPKSWQSRSLLWRSVRRRKLVRRRKSGFGTGEGLIRKGGIANLPEISFAPALISVWLALRR